MKLKTCIIQPLYTAEYADSDRLYQWELDALDRCDDSMDLIVMPEACDVPAFAKTKEDFLASYHKYNAGILTKAAETAKRCRAMLFVNAVCKVGEAEDGTELLRNTTYAFDREGQPAGTYDKQHLTPGEVSKRKLDSDYTFRYTKPTVIEMEGIRFAFLTCYDFYFYEAFAALARVQPDVIIGCSHQRTDSHGALEMMTRFCAYNTGAWVVRSSVSMGEDSPVGGGSMIVSPDGTLLCDMGSRVGMDTAEFDPMEKYLKPAGFGGDLMPHWQYIEAGRRPWKYRPAGPAMVPGDRRMGYPRVCAHRGFSDVAPENSMPAFGAAVALGAEEIEFDLWATKDGEIVSLHDSKLDRVSDGTGCIWDHTLAELESVDFGCKFGEGFKGLRIVRFEDILAKFACQVVMNIHVKSPNNTDPLPVETLEKIVSLIRQYDCEKHVYFMTGNDVVMEQLHGLAPEIVRCVGGGNDFWGIVDRAIAMGCEKVQLVKGSFNQEMIDKAHEHGILCNVFWSDDPEETKRYLDMGIDVILSNNYLQIANTVKEWKESKR